MTSVESEGSRIRRDRTLARLAELRDLQGLDHAAYSARTLRLLQSAIARARATTTYYERALQRIPSPESYTQIHDLLDDIPVLTRVDMQQHGDSMRSKDPSLGSEHLVVSRTSGSTGKPVTVVKHGPTAAVDFDAITLLESVWHDLPRVTDMVMFRAISPEEEGEGPVAAPLTYVGAQGRAVWRSNRDRSPAELLNVLHDVRPGIVVTNGVVLRQVCLEQMSGNRASLSVGHILSISDRVDRGLRELAATAFSATVIDRYSSEECGILALQCPRYAHLHAMGDSLHLEVVDENGIPCEPGEPGRLLVTNLRSVAQPLIRYELGDQVTLGEPCDSGIVWPVIERVDGRLRDGVTLPDGAFHMVSFHGTVLLADPRILDYIVVAFDDAACVLVRLSCDWSDELAAQIASEVAHAFRILEHVYVRPLTPEAHISAAKRQEWYRGIGAYRQEMTQAQVVAAIAR